MILGVSIEKELTWRGQAEQFANVYHFDTDAGYMSEDLVQAVIAVERPAFSTQVKFRRAKVWGPTDQGVIASEMLLQADLTGTGSRASNFLTGFELAAVVSWNTGRKNSKGGPVFLRKYLHVGAITTAGGPELGNTALPSQDLDILRNYGNGIKNVGGATGLAANLCDKKGRKLPLNTSPKILPHLHTRQFRR